MFPVVAACTNLGPPRFPTTNLLLSGSGFLLWSACPPGSALSALKYAVVHTKYRAWRVGTFPLTASTHQYPVLPHAADGH